MRLLIALIAVLLAAPATAQVTAPTYRNSAGQLQDSQGVLILDTSGNAANIGGGTGASASQTQGNAAAGTADSGNPVKIGGVYNSTFPTYTTGQRTDIQTTARGLPIVALGNNSAALVGIATPTDGQAATDALAVRSLGQVSDGTSWYRMRGDTTGQYMVGNVAAGSTDAGNPVKFGCVYNSTAPTYTAGQRGDCQLGTRGATKVQLQLADNSNPVGFTFTGADGVSNTSVNALNVYAFPSVFDGTTWNRAPGNTTGQYVVSKGGASLATGQVSVTTSSTLVAAARSGRGKITVSIGAANTCAFGNTGVTTTTGFPLAPTVGASLTLDTSAALYAVCSATTTVSFIEQY